MKLRDNRTALFISPALKTIHWHWWRILWGAFLVSQVVLLSNNAAIDTGRNGAGKVDFRGAG